MPTPPLLLPNILNWIIRKKKQNWKSNRVVSPIGRLNIDVHNTFESFGEKKNKKKNLSFLFFAFFFLVNKRMNGGKNKNRSYYNKNLVISGWSLHKGHIIHSNCVVFKTFESFFLFFLSRISLMLCVLQTWQKVKTFFFLCHIQLTIISE